MKNQNEQLGLFTEQDFEPRDIEQAELMKSKTDPGTPHFFVPWMGNDCVHYVGAAQCAAHGDFVECKDCCDYKSVYGNDIEDAD